MSILTMILKCLIIGVIWAALLIPVIFKRGGALKYILTVLITALLCFVFCYWLFSYGWLVNQMTIIALVSLVISWIVSMAVFEKESKVKSKVISFTCVIAAVAYMVTTLFIDNLQFL